VLPLPQTTEYALRALLLIATRHPLPLRVPELAELARAPENYLAKTLNQLTRAGILVSTRGRSGGFRLAMNPAELTLDRVVEVFSQSTGQRCLLGHGTCGENPGCTVHSRWKPVARELRDFFSRTTIADLIATDDAGEGQLAALAVATTPVS
jgi:Rrf2 family protein